MVACSSRRSIEHRSRAEPLSGLFGERFLAELIGFGKDQFPDRVTRRVQLADLVLHRAQINDVHSWKYGRRILGTVDAQIERLRTTPHCSPTASSNTSGVVPGEETEAPWSRIQCPLVSSAPSGSKTPRK